LGFCGWFEAADNFRWILTVAMATREQLALSKSATKMFGALGAPVLAFLLIVAIAWFCMWRWLGNLGGSSQLPPDVIAALVARPSPSRPPIPPLFLPKGNGILVFSPLGPWRVRADLYQMIITLSDAGYNYRFAATGTSVAYSGDDLQLASLVTQLSFNPVAQKNSGAPQELIDNLRANFARKLSSPPMQISDSDTQSLEDIWVQYVLATDPANRKQIGTNLVDKLESIGKSSDAQNRNSWQQTITQVRQLIPPTDQADYEAKIRDGFAFHTSATRPTP
jgi:hypothetical protein